MSQPEEWPVLPDQRAKQQPHLVTEQRLYKKYGIFAFKLYTTYLVFSFVTWWDWVGIEFHVWGDGLYNMKQYQISVCYNHF